MELISDGLLFLTALTTGFYCLVLARRLRRFGSAENGIGPRIQALSAAVEEMRGALGQTQLRLEEMRRESSLSSERMTRETARARRIAEELEAAASSGERTLDALYRADRKFAGARFAPEAAPGPAPGAALGAALGAASGSAPGAARRRVGLPDMEGALEIRAEEPQEGDGVDEPVDALGAAAEEPAREAGAPAGAVGWIGGDVLKIERVSL